MLLCLEFQYDSTQGFDINRDVAIALQCALQLLTTQQVGASSTLALLDLQVVESMGGDGDIHCSRLVVEVSDNQQQLAASFAQEGVLALIIAVDIHEVEGSACDDGLLTGGEAFSSLVSLRVAARTSVSTLQ